MTKGQEFVVDRLKRMNQYWGMWAGTRAEFGLQVALLIEFYFLDKPEAAPPTHDILRSIFGPGPIVGTGRLEADWVRTCIKLAMEMLGLPAT